MSEWISVKDRLPTEGGYYLVIVWHMNFHYLDVQGYNTEGKYWVMREYLRVSHWMKLPQEPDLDHDYWEM